MAYGLTQSVDLESGSSQYLGRADEAAFDVTTNWTIEMWINTESNISGGKSFLFAGKDDGGSGQRSYSFGCADIAGTLKISGYTFANGGNVNYAAAEMNYTPPVGTWAHIACAFDGSQSASSRFRFVIGGVDQGNGTNVSGGTGATSAFNSSAAFRLGSYANSSLVTLGYLYDGKVSLARFWNTTRTPTEIANNMCNVFGGATTGLVAEWSLNGVFTDASGNGLTLNANGGSPGFVSDIPSTCASVPLNAWNGVAWSTVSNLNGVTEATISNVNGVSA